MPTLTINPSSTLAPLVGAAMLGRSLKNVSPTMTIDLHQARPIQGIPSEKDFGGCLDAQSAWKHIGGMTLPEAHHVFLDNPIYYQEDYMFMECRAFNYYFPVIDKYLREVTSEDEYDDCEVYILGCAIVAQFEWNGAKHSHITIKEIEELTKYVLSNVHQYSQTEKDNKRINKKWNEVATKLSQYQTNKANKSQ